jgi:hypothetical protein
MIFEHDNFGGWHQVFPPGSYNMVGNSDNQISSLRVGHHCQVTLYESPNEQGWSAQFGAGDYNLASLMSGGAHNDQISSIRVAQMS